jgi:hypothetical protein
MAAGQQALSSIMLKIPKIIRILALTAGLSPPAGMAASFPGVSVFAVPALETGRQAVIRDIAEERFDAALVRVDRLIAEAPEAASLRALRALALARTDRRDDAVAALAEAARLGFPDLGRLLASPPFAGLEKDPRVAALRPAPPRPGKPPAPEVVEGGWARVGENNTRWNDALGMFESYFTIPVVPTRDRGRATARGDDAPEIALLAKLRRRGLAAGHRGDLYDNRDREHSRLDRSRFPQLDAIAYRAPARAIDLDYGLNDRILFNATVFGNSSTAMVDPVLERSLSRLAMTTPGAPMRLFAQYAANQIYVYPEHRDHDPGSGDLFPAALPYLLTSQGSSGSDRPLLHAVALILAALRPDTKAFLREKGLIAPTIQMLFRRALAGDDAAYLDGAAHPSAFDGGRIDFVRVVRLANALTRDAVPPMARLRVAQEEFAGASPGPFADGLTEILFDTPSAAARVARGLAQTRRYVLDAGETADPNGRPLRFHWRLLRGDPGLVTLRPLDPDGRRVEATISWHERFLAPGRADLTTDRVDIGLFADNGAALSAPAFFSVYFPPRQKRVYDADGRLLSVDFADPARARRYEDPLLIPARDWRDAFDYAADGSLLGWTRTRKDGVSRFTRHGARILARDAQDRPVEAGRVAYPVTRDASGRLAVTETPTGEVLRYGYDAPGDAFGSVDSVTRP